MRILIFQMGRHSHANSLGLRTRLLGQFVFKRSE